MEKLTSTLIHIVASHLLPESTSKTASSAFPCGCCSGSPPPRGCPKIPVGAQRTARIKSCTYVESCLLIYRDQLSLALPDGPALKFLDRGDINQSHNSDFNPTPRHHRSLSEGRSCCSPLDSLANSTSCMHSLGKSGQTSSDCITLPETAHNLKWMNGLFL